MRRRIRSVTALAATTMVSAALALGVPTAGASPPDPAIAYNAIPTALPGNVPSVGFEATSTSEFGDLVQLAGGGTAAQAVSVVLSSWGCQSGSWTGTCTTAPGATFAHPVTLNLYEVDHSGSTPAPGPLITSVTQTFQIPYRPSTDPVCGDGRWSIDGTTAGCFNGLATVITFDLSSTALALPGEVIWTVAYDTTHHGHSPLGESATCYGEDGGCGYDSLNVGVESFDGQPSAGVDLDPDGVVQDSTWSGAYCDGGAGGTGTLRVDTGCWTGYRPLVTIAGAGLDLRLKGRAGRFDVETYRPLGNGTDAQASWSTMDALDGAHSMFLQKTTNERFAYAAAVVQGVEGMPVAALGDLAFSFTGPCNGGSPRFNLYFDSDADGSANGIAFLGCNNVLLTDDGNGWHTATFPGSMVVTWPHCYDFDPPGPCSIGTPGATETSLSVLIDIVGTHLVDRVTVGQFVTGEPSGA